MITRIAPSPSGYLHAGNIFSFLLTRAIADKFGGQVILRIDDLDGERSRRQFLDDIFESLGAFEIRYDAGPANTKDFLENYSQRLRVGTYGELIEKLETTSLVYACQCSRKQLAVLQQLGKKRCCCRAKKLALNHEGTCLKIFVPESETVHFNDELHGSTTIPLFENMGDFIIRRRDGIPSYQLASLSDDIHFGINYIVRGEDLLASTAAQLYLAKLLGLKQFSESRFLHHSLLNDAGGKKLSKSAGSLRAKAMMQHSEIGQQITANMKNDIDRLLQNL